MQNKDMTDETLEKLLDIVDGTEDISDEELATLADSTDASDAMRNIMLCDEAANTKIGRLPDVDAEWQRFSHRTFQYHRANRIKIYSVILAAASIIIVTVIFFWTGRQSANLLYEAQGQRAEVTMSTNSQQNVVVRAKQMVCKSIGSRVETEKIVVPEGKTFKITLSDGTQVWLNASSRLSYPSRFTGRSRVVELSGEAYFKVFHDAAHPFVIHAGDVSTKVLGTEFNVRCYNAVDTHVTLVSGSVQVSTMQKQVVIRPGEDMRFTGSKIEINNVDVNDFTSWRDGLVFFDNATLRDILQQLGSWYNVNVVCSNPSLLNLHFHYIYDRNDNLENALKTLNESSNIKVKMENHTIFVS
jgi:ferric-dicitrate binding protein FerR (iron transport regulator)